MGPIFTLNGVADITLDSVAMINARFSTNMSDGYGIYAPSTAVGTRMLHVVDSSITNASNGGIYGAYITAEILRSTFDGNVLGVQLEESTVMVDRSSFTSNGTFGLYVSGAYSVTNSFIARNQIGLVAGNASSASIVAFNTVVDNAADGVDCVSSTVTTVLANSIVARNNPNLTQGTSCPTTGSIIVDDPTSLHFVHPDSAPYDYHIGAGSVAIDAASGGNVPPIDYDGEIRPKGSAADVGADEAF